MTHADDDGFVAPPRLADPVRWHLARRSPARAVAVGLFSGLIPGPFQVIGSVALCHLIAQAGDTD